MFKKIYLTCALSLAAMALPALGMATTDIASLTSQLNNINAQMSTIKRAWNVERLHVRMAEKASATLYSTLKNTFDKIIASDDFTTKMNTVVDMQCDSIVTNNTSFDSIKAENSLADFFPNLSMNEFGRKLYTAMANKTYYLRLGQKLSQKAQEIVSAIKTAQQEAINAQQAVYQ